MLLVSNNLHIYSICGMTPIKTTTSTVWLLMTNIPFYSVSASHGIQTKPGSVVVSQILQKGSSCSLHLWDPSIISILHCLFLIYVRKL